MEFLPVILGASTSALCGVAVLVRLGITAVKGI